MSWTSTSATCNSVYDALGDMKQFDDLSTLEAAGPLQMQDLAFYSAVASAGINNANALADAKTLDNSLINTYAGTYNAGSSTAIAVEALSTIMRVGTKTVEDLSDMVGTLYSFS